MPNYAVRITHDYAKVAPIVYAWALRSDKILAYEHSKETETARDKTHVHLLLVNTNVDKKQLRNIAMAAKCVPVNGNGNMSFKEADLDGTYITYMSKGKINPSYNKGYESSALEDLKAKWTPPNEYVKANPWKKLYEEYAVYAPTPRKVDWEAWAKSTETEPPRIDNFSPLEEHAKKWLSRKLDGVWCPQYKNMLNCLIYTHCWKYDITIPKNWKP